MLQRIRWTLSRVLFLALYTIMLLTGGLFAFLVAPLTSYLMFGNWRFWENARFYFPMTLIAYRQLGMLMAQPGYRRCCTLPLAASPRMAPNKKLVQVAADWEAPEIDCAGCSQCCLKFGCPLFDQETGRCRSYNSFYWRYFNCGRYPATQAQIDYYNCPKWVMKTAHKIASA